MDELLDNEATAVNDIDNRQFLHKHGSSNMIELQEMVIPGDINLQESINVLTGKNINRVDTSDHACASPRCVDRVMVEELTVRSFNSGTVPMDASSTRDKVQHFRGPMPGVWEDSGSTLFPELLDNNKEQDEDQNDAIDHSRHEEKQPILLSPDAIRTKILSKSGFSQYFVKHTLKGKGVVFSGPARDGLGVRIQNENHQKETGVRASDTIVEPRPSVALNTNHEGLSLREWLKAGRNKVDKSKSLYIFKQILDLVDSSHSRGVALQTLRPSCFKLMPSNQVLYLVEKEFKENFGDKELRHSQSIGNEKRQLEHDDVLGASQSLKRRKHGENRNSLSRWPQFPVRSGFKYGSEHDSGYGFNGGNVMPDTSQMVSNFGSDLLEEQWYASLEDPRQRCSTFSSNIYSLGVLLFELLGSFESARSHAIAMMDLRHRILPPSFLSENPKEAGFCLWLLHPEASLRPTTRDILQSKLVSEIQESSLDKLSSSIDQEEAESELLSHFLESLKERKQKSATKLIEQIKRLESDISEVELRRANNSSHKKSSSIEENSPSVGPKPISSTFSNLSGSRLINNISHLEDAYFSMRSNVQIADGDMVKRVDHEVLRNRENNMRETENKSLDRLGVFFNGLCKYARYSKFEVRGALRNGDFSSSANVICSLGFDRDEDYFATAGVSKKIKVYDFHALLNSSVDIHYPAVEMSNKAKISCISWNSYIRNYLASSDHDGVVKLWDAGTGETVSQHIEHERRAWSVDFSRVDPTKFASGSDDCSVKLWSVNEKKSISTIKSIANVCCVQFSPYSTHLLSLGSADYRTYCYDLRNVSAPLCTLSGHDRAVSYVKFLDSETLVSASTDNTLKLWDLNKASFGYLSTCSCILTFKGHTNEKNFVGLSVADDGYIACGSETNEVFAYYKSLPMPITFHKFGSIDPISGKETENESNQFVSSVCWRQKSDMVVAANSSGCLKLLQMV